MDAVEERKFKRTYQPYIETGRRIDLALKAVDFGISKMKNRALADFLKYVYIDGEDKPRVADATKHFDISTTSFYNMRDKAISELTRMMFGSADKSSKRELHAIIAWLSYENNEELFGEALFEFLA